MAFLFALLPFLLLATTAVVARCAVGFRRKLRGHPARFSLDGNV